MQPLFTIGHSNHSQEKFIQLLNLYNITALADVRSAPYSRYLPHFNKKPLQNYLPSAEIHYVFLGAELGARPDNPDCYVDGKATYERIAATEVFQGGLQRLLKGIKQHRLALMCAEKDPLTCHRAILICQHLTNLNLEIAHIHSDGELEYHENLEERMLCLHGLGDPKETQQLSLFPDQGPALPPKSERLAQAYYQQGGRIAYVEKDNH
ncbi:MAG: DUF488 family protein [Synechocystis sp.]